VTTYKTVAVDGVEVFYRCLGVRRCGAAAPWDDIPSAATGTVTAARTATTARSLVMPR
jgi:hypothetical protein